MKEAPSTSCFPVRISIGEADGIIILQDFRSEFRFENKAVLQHTGMCKRGQIREANSLNNVNIRVEECRYHVLNSLHSSALVIKIPPKNEIEKKPERLLSVVGTAKTFWKIESVNKAFLF